MNSLMMKWGLLLKSLGITTLLILLRFVIYRCEWDTLELTTLISSFIGGAIFTVAIIFTGTLSDYKESERIPGDLATAIRAVSTDFNFCRSNPQLVASAQNQVLDLLSCITKNFKKNSWDVHEITRSMDAINQSIWKMADANVAPPMIVKLRLEISNIDRLCNRIRQISETSFIPAAYAIAELATVSTIALLLFVKVNFSQWIVIFAILSTLLISLLLLIKDMDDPFEVGTKSYADVDLFLLWDLETELQERSLRDER